MRRHSPNLCWRRDKEEGGLGNNENSNQSEIYLRGKKHEYRHEKLLRLFGPSAQTEAVIVKIMFMFKGNQEPLEEPLENWVSAEIILFFMFVDLKKWFKKWKAVKAVIEEVQRVGLVKGWGY